MKLVKVSFSYCLSMKKFNKQNIIIFLIFLFTLVLMSVFIIIEIPSKSSKAIFFSIILVLLLTMITWFAYFTKIKNQNEIKSSNSLNLLTNRALNYGNVGIINYGGKNDSIISISPFLQKRNFNKYVGKSLSKISSDFKKISSLQELTILLEGRTYDFKIFPLLKTILVKDITEFQKIYSLHNNHQSGIIFIKVDHYSQSSIDIAEGVNRVDIVVSEYLTIWSKKYKGFLRLSSAPGEINIIFINKSQIHKSLENPNDNILQGLKKALTLAKVKAIVSVAISYGNADNATIGKLASEALEMCISRGGDQTIIKEYGKPIIFEESFVEKSSPSSLLSIKFFLKKVMKEINNSDVVIVAGHHYADMDAIAAQIGFAYLCHEYSNKKCYVIIDTVDNTSIKAIDKLIPVKLKPYLISIQKAVKISTEKTLHVVVDTSSMEQTPIEKVLKRTIKRKKVLIIDHHRVNEDKIKTFNKEMEYIDTSASSTSEIIANMLELLVEGKVDVIPSLLANFLLTGIYLDTAELTRKTTTKTLNTCSWLAAQGAQTNIAHEYLKIEIKNYQKILEITNSFEIYKDNIVIAHTSDDKVFENTIISQAAEHLIKLKNVKAAFIVSKISKNVVKLSARSIDDFNVQQICERMGGGGHFQSSAVTRKDKGTKALVEELKFIIDSIMERQKKQELLTSK